MERRFSRSRGKGLTTLCMHPCQSTTIRGRCQKQEMTGHFLLVPGPTGVIVLIHMKSLRLFAAALTLFFSSLLQAQMQVDLTKDVKGMAPAANGGVPAGVAAGSRMISSGVGQPGVYQTKLVNRGGRV